MFRSVAVPVLPRVAPFELGVLTEAFGLDRSDQGLPTYDFWVCAERPGEPLSTKSGYDLLPRYGFEMLDAADVIAVPAGPFTAAYPPQLLDAIRRAIDRDALVLSVCTGAFVLGAAGLLDGRDCTTHWMYAEELQHRYPNARVDPDVLFVGDGQVWTSAGTAAGIDLCLHLIREHEGSEVARAVARRMVVAPQRTGGQKQFVETPLPTSRVQTLEPLLTWMAAHLDEPMAVATLADRANMSARTLARRFQAETGVTPHDWLTGQRILLARQLLETSDQTIDAIAARVGFGNAAALRHHFTSRVGTTPQAYRATFKLRKQPA